MSGPTTMHHAVGFRSSSTGPSYPGGYPPVTVSHDRAAQIAVTENSTPAGESLPAT
jgi:hypothetical protein